MATSLNVKQWRLFYLFTFYFAGKKAEKLSNSWQENYLYEMELDESYNLQSPGHIVGIPTTTNAQFTYRSDGPMDPRYMHISVRGRVRYLSSRALGSQL